MKQNTFDRALSIFIALLCVGVSLYVAYLGLSMVLTMQAHSPLNWLLPIVFFGIATFICIISLRNLNRVLFPERRRTINQTPPVQSRSSSTELAEYAGAWRGGDISLEIQIENLERIGLTLSPERDIEQLLREWSRDAYETDPYGTLLFMYGSGYCQRGWDFDMECLTSEGDYVAALEPLVRITGQPDILTDLTDKLDVTANKWSVSYTINGQDRQLMARVDRDWVDPKVLDAFVQDIEMHIGNGMRFWYADNGQALTFFFLSDSEAKAINELRDGILMR